MPRLEGMCGDTYARLDYEGCRVCMQQRGLGPRSRLPRQDAVGLRTLMTGGAVAHVMVCSLTSEFAQC